MKTPWERLLPAAVFLGGLLLYVSTLAPSVVFGDPAEYTFVPYAWGVIHPPGYAFQTVLTRLWQTAVPLGTVAWRTNLLAATAAAAAVTLVFGAVGLLAEGRGPRADGRGRMAEGRGQAGGWEVLPGCQMVGAAALAVSANFWQHALHANAHIMTALLAALSIYCLLCWRASGNDRWLAGFAFTAGLSVTHHPLLVFSFPAYSVFVLAHLGWPPKAKEFRRILAALPWAVAGLLPWLYFPIRSAISPPPVIGPHDMNTLDGFLNLVLARGLRVNLFHFGLEQQWQRLIVFWSLLRLQMSLPILALMPIGLVHLWRRDWRAALLFTTFLGVNLAFIMNTVQDVMAYFLTPWAGLAMLAGTGAWALVEQWRGEGRGERGEGGGGREEAITNHQLPIVPATLAILLLFPLLTLLHNYPRVSLRGYRAADEYVDGLFARFAGKGEGAILLSDWERLTPLWYREHVAGQRFDPADLTPVFVSGGERPWVDAVWAHIEAGPIYVVEYQPQIAAEGFRLRAEGTLYRVLGPPAVEAPPIAAALGAAAGPVEILGYELGATEARAGDAIPLTLYLRAPEAVSDIVFPHGRLGPFGMQWTTDSHLLTPHWEAGEIIAERFDVIVPLDAPAGEYPLRLGMANLTTGEPIPVTPNIKLQTTNNEAELPSSEGQGLEVELAMITVAANPAAPPARALDGLRANFGQRVGIERAWAWAGGRRHSAPWPEPIALRPGEAIHLFLEWRALAPSETSLTVFIHLLDAGNGVWAGRDYTPLGGAFPTLLWFPKWLEGQRALDPYTITIPADAPPGDYYLEAGLYGLRTIQRAPAFDRAGNLAGDRFILGGVRVEK